MRERVAWILSYTPVGSEPRLLRQARALADTGWRVVVFGFEGHTPPPPEWRHVVLPSAVRAPFVMRVVLRGLREVGLALARFGVLTPVQHYGARLYQSSIPHARHCMREVLRFQSAHPELKPDLVLAHDYHTADVGYAVAQRAGARFSVDCHEYARGQSMHDASWTRRMRPYVRAIQDHYLALADGVTTVCDGIAELLDAEQELKRPVQVVRSVPFRAVQPFRPTGERITVLYHGEIYYMRGLHKAIKSMPAWRSEFDLVLRGNADPPYLEYLETLVAELGLQDRVRFEPPVRFHEIIPAANRADIGYFVHKDLGPQKRFVLPNKFFEYVMAGLALCVSDLPEMARLVNRYGFGRLVGDYDEQAIADAINGFDRPTIDAMKRRAIAAADELNWEAEQGRMLSFYEELMQ